MKYKVTLNNKVYEVAVEQGEAIMLDVSDAPAPAPVAAAAPVPAAPPPPVPAAAPAPAAPVAAGGGETVTAPLSGNVVAIKVAPGESVKKGQALAVLEAMKMENEVLSPRDGVVGQIIAAKGATVQTGAPLLTLR